MRLLYDEKTNDQSQEAATLHLAPVCFIISAQLKNHQIIPFEELFVINLKIPHSAVVFSVKTFTGINFEVIKIINMFVCVNS